MGILFVSCPEFEGKKIVNHARHEAVKIYQSVSKKEQITEDITLFYLVYANQIFWAVARFCNRNYPSSNIGKAVNSNIKSFCRERFDGHVLGWFEKQQVCPLVFDLQDEKKVRWEIRMPDEAKSVLEKKAKENGQQINEFVIQVLDSYCREQDCEKLLEFDLRERLFTFLCIAHCKENETTWAIENRNTIMLEAQEQTYQILSDKDWLLLCSIYSWRLNRLALDVRPIPPRARVKCLEYVEQGVGRLNLEPRLHLVEQEESQDA